MLSTWVTQPAVVKLFVTSRDMALVADAPVTKEHLQLNQNDLAVPARNFCRQANTTRTQAARDMKVSQTSIFNTEESPDQGLIKLRMRMIEAYSKFKVSGPVYLLEEK